MHTFPPPMFATPLPPPVSSSSPHTSLPSLPPPTTNPNPFSAESLFQTSKFIIRLPFGAFIDVHVSNGQIINALTKRRGDTCCRSSRSLEERTRQQVLSVSGQKCWGWKFRPTGVSPNGNASSSASAHPCTSAYDTVVAVGCSYNAFSTSNRKNHSI